ncbi:MAG TPA: hypothetical protein PKO06_12295, partial [Candidatus Ozemobacteraceae bacterium]|nr:hypothetical protein [Candidatus Ozemobacteraceae bacterium]
MKRYALIRLTLPVAVLGCLLTLPTETQARNDRRRPVSPPTIEVSPTPGFESAARQHQIRSA